MAGNIEVPLMVKKSSTRRSVERSDMYAEVQNVDLNKGQILVKEATSGKLYAISLKNNYKKGDLADKPYVGGILDERMQRKLNPRLVPSGETLIKSYVIVEQFEKGSELEDGITEGVARWLNKAPAPNENPNENKVVPGVLSITMDKKGCAHKVCVWGSAAVSPNKFEALAQVLTASAKAKKEFELAKEKSLQTGVPLSREKWPVLPSQGFQIRLLDSSNTVQHVSKMFDWNTEEGRQFDGDDFKGAYAYYNKKAEELGLKAEVLAFRGFSIGRANDERNNSYLIQIGSTNGRTSTNALADQNKGSESEMVFVKENEMNGQFGARGLILLSTGKYNPDSGVVEGKQNNFVVKTFMSAPRRGIQELIKTLDGQYPKLPDELMPVLRSAEKKVEKDVSNENQASTPDSAQPSTNQAEKETTKQSFSPQRAVDMGRF